MQSLVILQIPCSTNTVDSYNQIGLRLECRSRPLRIGHSRCSKHLPRKGDTPGINSYECRLTPKSLSLLQRLEIRPYSDRYEESIPTVCRLFPFAKSAALGKYPQRSPLFSCWLPSLCWLAPLCSLFPAERTCYSL